MDIMAEHLTPASTTISPSELFPLSPNTINCSSSNSRANNNRNTSSDPSNSSPRKSSRMNSRGRATRLHLEIPRVVVNSQTMNEAARRHLRWKRHCRIQMMIVIVILTFFMIVIRLTNLPVLMQGFRSASDIDLKLIPGRYSYVNSIKDLTTSSVQVWCQDPDIPCNKTCLDPLVPLGRTENARWSRLHQKNIEMANNFERSEVDVAFLGDSITEGWMGTLLENRIDHLLGDSHLVFSKHFSVTDGAKYQGVALGISGDTSSNLLWRLQHGELSEKLEPTVFWILIGTNDIKNGCSPEIVLIGILRVVEELLYRRPQSTVVINGILPRTNNKHGYVEQPGSAKGKLSQMVYWESIKAVNRELQKYAIRRNGVQYFETNAFFKDPTVLDKDLQIDTDLMRDHLHPHANGYEKWAQEIETKLERIIPV